MPELLTTKEVSRFYKWSIWARPMMIYALTASMVGMVATVMYLLITNQATINDSSGLIIAIFSTIAPILAAIVLGKSYERTKGVTEEDKIPSITTPNTPTQSVGGVTLPSQIDLTKIADITDPSVLLSDNPMDILNALPLDEFMPKMADDKPVI